MTEEARPQGRHQNDVNEEKVKHGMHQDDADEEDDSVKQLQQCSTLYLLLQVSSTDFHIMTLNPKPSTVDHLHQCHWIDIFFCRIVLLTLTETGNLARKVCLFPLLSRFCGNWSEFRSISFNFINPNPNAWFSTSWI